MNAAILAFPRRRREASQVRAQGIAIERIVYVCHIAANLGVDLRDCLSLTTGDVSKPIMLPGRWPAPIPLPVRAPSGKPTKREG